MICNNQDRSYSRAACHAERSIVILSVAKDLSRWAHRCFASLSMTSDRPLHCPYARLPTGTRTWLTLPLFSFIVIYMDLMKRFDKAIAK